MTSILMIKSLTCAPGQAKTSFECQWLNLTFFKSGNGKIQCCQEFVRRLYRNQEIPAHNTPAGKNAYQEEAWNLMQCILLEIEMSSLKLRSE